MGAKVTDIQHRNIKAKSQVEMCFSIFMENFQRLFIYVAIGKRLKVYILMREY